MKLGQETDGPQAAQLEFFLSGQILQEEDNSRREEKLSPVQIKDKQATFSHFQGQRDLPTYTCAEMFLGGRKGRGHHTTVDDVNLPISLFSRIHLG